VADEILSQLALDRADPTPLYFQLEKQLLSLIEQGDLRPGDRVPGDIQLSEVLGLNRWTVRKAMSRLVGKGLLKRTRRAGTFVTGLAAPAPTTIGFFYFFEASPTMGKRAEHIQQHCSSQGADLIIVAYQRDYFDAADVLDEARKKRLKGLIIMPLDTPACLRSLKRLEDAGFPYVRFGNSWFTGQLKAPLVTGDSVGCAKQAFDHLWGLGHRRIGFFGKHPGNITERTCLDIMACHGPFPGRWAGSYEYDGTLEEWGKLPAASITRAYLDDNPDLTAIITEDGSAALEFVRQSRAAGRRVPDDLSIISLTGEWLGFEGGTLTVSSLSLSNAEIAETAARVLFETIRNGPPTEEVIHYLPFQLHARESTTPPKGG